ncbi:hypothetical protein AB0D90_03500 [Streptomyces althioticus]|uniref:hypothetical protein n=1 Tax=Streptomyces althioticus TaxID=83380 RepID=UPI0033D93573
MQLFPARKTTDAKTTAEMAAEIDRLHGYIDDLETTIGTLLPHTEEAARLVESLRERDVYVGEKATEFADREIPLTGVLTGAPGVKMPAVDPADPRMLPKTRAAYLTAWQSAELGLDLPSTARLIHDVWQQMDAMPSHAFDKELVETVADVLARTLHGEPLADLRDEHAADYREAAEKVAALVAPAGATQGV